VPGAGLPIHRAATATAANTWRHWPWTLAITSKLTEGAIGSTWRRLAPGAGPGAPWIDLREQPGGGCSRFCPEMPGCAVGSGAGPTSWFTKAQLVAQGGATAHGAQGNRQTRQVPANKSRGFLGSRPMFRPGLPASGRSCALVPSGGKLPVELGWLVGMGNHASWKLCSCCAIPSQEWDW